MRYMAGCTSGCVAVICLQINAAMTYTPVNCHGNISIQYL